MTTRRRLLGLAAGGVTMPALSRLARAQSWPARPIRIIIPFQAGTTVDIVGRIVLDPLSSQLGQAIVFENRGSAGGTLGAAAVAKGEPDGYTILVNASAHSAAPAAYPLPYDTIDINIALAKAAGLKFN
jgi:tripartite-type tricarboxylate transporter receptor subunit TctC